jgi:hypothetical protein
MKLPTATFFAILVAKLLSASASDCADRDSACVVLSCIDGSLENTECTEFLESSHIDNETISFIHVSDLPNDSMTYKFIKKLNFMNENETRNKSVTWDQLSYLMMHKIQYTVNGVWYEYDVKNALLPIASLQNSTDENEVEVFYYDCSLIDINMKFVDLVDTMTSHLYISWNCVEVISFFIYEYVVLTNEGLASSRHPVMSFLFFILMTFSHMSLTFYSIWSSFKVIYFNYFTSMLFVPVLVYL